MIGTAFAPGWPSLLVLRFLAGIAFSGLPATAMAYVGEEMAGPSMGLAMGLYIGGTGLGALGGRLIVGLATDVLSWRVGLFIVGLLALASSVVFKVYLPESRHFRPHPPSLRALAASFAQHLRNGRVAGALCRGLPAARRLRGALQLSRLPAAGAALRVQSDLGRPDLLHLAHRHRERGLGRRSGEPARPLAGALGPGADDLCRDAGDPVGPALADPGRDDAGDVLVLRRPYGGVGLGGTAGAAGQSPSLVALPVQLLHRIEPHRLGRRDCLGAVRLARRRRALQRRAGACARSGPGAGTRPVPGPYRLRDRPVGRQPDAF